MLVESRFPLLPVCIMLSLLLVLTACDALERNAREGGESLHRAYDETRYKIANYIYDDSVMPAPDAGTTKPALFCYQLPSDVLCYSAPQPHLALNLIAVQGDHHYSYEEFLPKDALEQQGLSRRSGSPITVEMRDVAGPSDDEEGASSPNSIQQSANTASDDVPVGLMGR